MSTFKLKFESHQEALKVIRESSIGFLVIAGLQALLGFLVVPAVLLDAALYGILALLLYFIKSRVVAVLLLLLSLLTVATTFLNRIGVMDSGGNNIFLSLAIFYLALRAVFATFALHRDPALPDTQPPAAGASALQPHTPQKPPQPRSSRLERWLLIAVAFLIGIIAFFAALLLRA